MTAQIIDFDRYYYRPVHAFRHGDRVIVLNTGERGIVEGYDHDDGRYIVQHYGIRGWPGLRLRYAAGEIDSDPGSAA